MSPLDTTSALVRRGPGLIEACLWVFGYLLAQLLALGVFLAGLILVSFGGIPASRADVVSLMLEIELDRSFVPFGVANLLCLAFLFPAVRLRLGRSARAALQLEAPNARHLLLISGAVIPLAIVSEQLYRWSLAMWGALATIWPVLAPWSRSNAVDVMMKFSREESYPILVIAIALGPAIGEELVFRGLIGRGLISRWGVRKGVWLTSLLFAAGHGFPPHALGTIPIGLFLHHVYLSTRSLWTPILVHFLNNLLVITLAHYSFAEGLPSSTPLVICAAAYVLVTARILWHDGAHATARAIEPHAAPATTSKIPILAASAVVAFTAAFVWTAMSS